ncbi:MAG: hypothetical protein IAE82_00785 [Opitutaceae bacterium]|nr:hypothetical protein [Opitutaceae bacterium]
MNTTFAATKLTEMLPQSDWLRFGVLLLALLAVLQIMRLVSRTNRTFLLVVVGMGTFFLFANWVRYRNEPTFLTPVVDVVAPYFPTKMREAPQI